MITRLLVCLATLAALSPAASTLPPPAAMKVNFNQHVRPLLTAKCAGCHGAGRFP